MAAAPADPVERVGREVRRDVVPVAPVEPVGREVAIRAPVKPGRRKAGALATGPQWLVAEASGRSGVSARVDGFTPEKRRCFVAALQQTGCLADAARAARVSTETARRWRRKDAEFARQCAAASAAAAAPLEMIAWQRAVIGAEEKVIRDGVVVQIKVKPSDAMLRLLLQAADPDKYGRMSPGGETRQQIEARVRREIAAEEESPEEALATFLAKLEEIEARPDPCPEGWWVGPGGRFIPDGWGPVTEAAQAAWAEEQAAAEQAAAEAAADEEPDRSGNWRELHEEICAGWAERRAAEEGGARKF